MNLGVKSGKIQVRNKAQCLKMINYLHKLPHEEMNSLSQTQLPFWKTCFRQMQDIELRLRVAR